MLNHLLTLNFFLLFVAALPVTMEFYVIDQHKVAHLYSVK